MLKNKNVVIVKRRLNLYLDFIINITYKIHSTHPGFDCLYENEDIKNHFNWCFQKVCEDFEKQEVYFYNNETIKSLLFELFEKEMYKTSELSPLRKYLSVWKKVFSDRSTKNIALMYNLYEKFDSTIV